MNLCSSWVLSFICRSSVTFEENPANDPNASVAGAIADQNDVNRDVEVGFPTSLPLTEVEVKRMQLFGDHNELINSCEV